MTACSRCRKPEACECAHDRRVDSAIAAILLACAVSFVAVFVWWWRYSA